MSGNCVRVALLGEPCSVGAWPGGWPPTRGVSRRPEVLEQAGGADLVLLNLECCISTRGRRWPDPSKPFFFRAPPVAVETLSRLPASCVTLANNHALDDGAEALCDTFEHLADAGIGWVGAGEDTTRARSPVVLEANGVRIAVLAVTDHPAGCAAGPDVQPRTSPTPASKDRRYLGPRVPRGGRPRRLRPRRLRDRSGAPQRPQTVLRRHPRRGGDVAWVRACFRRACRLLGTEVEERSDRLVVDVR